MVVIHETLDLFLKPLDFLLKLLIFLAFFIKRDSQPYDPY